jgi:CRISPR-associated exonuclease Cas4
MDAGEQILIQLSWIMHCVHCPRRFVLIAKDEVFEDNQFTLAGRLAHERVHDMGSESCAPDGTKTVRGIPLWSDSLGLIGRADAVEFLPDGSLVPVEYKVGKRQERRANNLQLCAQALCLEEMFGRPIPRGALYYMGSKRRVSVALDERIRSSLAEILPRMRTLLQDEALPPIPEDRKACLKCSFEDLCLPGLGSDVVRKASAELFKLES